MIYHLRQFALILNDYVRKWDKLSHIFLAFFERIHGKIYIVKLLKEKNNLLYTILKERNPEQLSNLEFQLYQEINSHFTQVLKELETTYPASQELSWMEKLQKKEQLLNQAREITWQWILTLKVLQTKYWREYI